MKLLATLSVLTLSAPICLAAGLTLSGPVDQQGAGFGSVLNVLALQGNGSESGSVLWNGAADVRSGDAKPFSQTRSVGEFFSAGAALSRFGIVLNIAQPGNNPDIMLNQFEVVFTSASGAELFTAEFNTPTLLAQISSGVGGAGYLFNVSLSVVEMDFFSNSANRIGIRVANPITGSQGAPENFYLVPASSTLLLLGPPGLMASLRRRRAVL